MSLHQVQIGTQVTVKSTGDVGLVKGVFYFPTVYSVELSDGSVEKFTTHDVDITGRKKSEPGIIKEKLSKKLDSGIDFEKSLFQVKTIVWQEIIADISDIWARLISLKDYHLWYPGIQRVLPLNDMGRYVHQFSFDQFDLKPGSHIRTRSNGVFPYLNGRILDIEEEKKFTLSLKLNPIITELAQFDLKQKNDRVLISCTRIYKGVFSLLGYFGFHKNKSLLLNDFQKTFFPQVSKSKEVIKESKTQGDSAPAMDRETTIAYAVNKGIKGDMDFINSIPDKPTRGLAKAALVKAKRTGVVPPMPDIPINQSLNSPKPGSEVKNGVPKFEDPQDLIHYAVNLALDGNMDIINGIPDKPTRGKAKALMVKSKRTGERPQMPELPIQPETMATEINDTSAPCFDSRDDLIHYTVNMALDGNMDPINSIEDKPTRGKAKALLVKSKRTGQRPSMPVIPMQSPVATVGSAEKVESEEELINRLVTEGVKGNMENINALDNKVLRGKIKAAVVREKRKGAN
tara:strand:- start:1885 stop:3429 length:1545 start_codon:yes stop_codon:yes gene_type:complete